MKFHIWSVTAKKWWCRNTGKVGKINTTDNRSEAGEFTLEEATELCCIVFDGQPIAAMVPVSHEISKLDENSCYTVPWPQRVAEVESIGFACGVLEGLELVAEPKIAAGIQEAIKRLRKPLETIKAK